MFRAITDKVAGGVMPTRPTALLLLSATGWDKN
jgi:hypothetical protein